MKNKQRGILFNQQGEKQYYIKCVHVTYVYYIHQNVIFFLSQNAPFWNLYFLTFSVQHHVKEQSLETDIFDVYSISICTFYICADGSPHRCKAYFVISNSTHHSSFYVTCQIWEHSQKHSNKFLLSRWLIFFSSQLTRLDEAKIHKEAHVIGGFL